MLCLQRGAVPEGPASPESGRPKGGKAGPLPAPRPGVLAAGAGGSGGSGPPRSRAQPAPQVSSRPREDCWGHEPAGGPSCSTWQWVPRPSHSPEASGFHRLHHLTFVHRIQGFKHNVQTPSLTHLFEDTWQPEVSVASGGLRRCAGALVAERLSWPWGALRSCSWLPARLLDLACLWKKTKTHTHLPPWVFPFRACPS